MAYSQRLEHRQRTLRHSTGSQSPCLWNSGRKQTDTADKYKLAALIGGKAEAPHSAQILDADHLRSEHVRYANRVDDIGTHEPLPSLHAKREVCAIGQRTSMSLPGSSGSQVNETFHEGSMNRDKEQAFVFIGGFALIVGLILAKLAGWA